MNVAAVMEQLGDALEFINGLRVFRYPPDAITAPAGIIAYPDDINYATSYQRGMDRMTVPVIIAVGKVSDRASAKQLAEYMSGSGTKSIKVVLDGYESYTAMDSVTVTRAETDVLVMGGVEYITAIFEVDVVGQGG